MSYSIIVRVSRLLHFCQVTRHCPSWPWVHYEGLENLKKIDFFIIFIGKSGIQRGGETERKIFRPIIHSASEHNGRCCANLEPGARNFCQISNMHAGSQSIGPSSTAFPGHKQGAGWEVEPLRLWAPVHSRQGLLVARPHHRALNY